MGIEPTLRAWEAPVLPLNYTRSIRANEPRQVDHRRQVGLCCQV